MIEEYMLTTVDNKWNPFTHFREWYEYDSRMGYNTLGLLANFALSDYENDQNDQIETNKAIDTICQDPFLGSFFRKVTKESFKELEKEQKTRNTAEIEEKVEKTEKNDKKDTSRPSQDPGEGVA